MILPQAVVENSQFLKNEISSLLQQGDICDRYFIDHIFSTENIGIVFHCAAQTHVGE